MKRALLLCVLALGTGVACAQDIQFGVEEHGAAKKQHVMLVDDAITVRADKPEEVELRFRVGPNLHINSHTPKDETLIATVLKVDSPGVKVLAEEYPAGVPFRLNIGAGQTLDTYQGEFRVRLRVEVTRGVSEMDGTLRYQACDNASCFPPRVLPVKVVVNAR